MDLQARKERFRQEFLKIQDEEILRQFENLLKINREKAKEEELQPMSLEQFHEEIEQSMDDLRNGKKKEASKLMQKYLNMKE